MTLVSILEAVSKDKKVEKPELTSDQLQQMADDLKHKFWDIRLSDKKWSNPKYHKTALNHMNTARAHLAELERSK